MASNLSMQPKDAAEISDMFFAANAKERALILHNLNDTPLKASARIPAHRANRAIHILEMAAFASDIENFALEVGEALILPARIAAQISADPGGEPLACAMKALEMPSPCSSASCCSSIRSSARRCRRSTGFRGCTTA